MGCLWSRVRQVGSDPAAELGVGTTGERNLIDVMDAIANILDFMIGDLQANRLGAGDIGEVPGEDWAGYEDVEEPAVVVIEPADEGGVPPLYENIWSPGPSSAPPRGASRDSSSLALSPPWLERGLRTPGWERGASKEVSPSSKLSPPRSSLLNCKALVTLGGQVERLSAPKC